MKQSERDEAEWNEPRNWHGGFLGIYGSRRDSRFWVPQRNRWMGYTVNLARPGARLMLLGLLPLLLILWVMGRLLPR